MPDDVEPQTGRNLIVCCDGTGNVWGNQRDTNVVKLVRLCVKDDAQLVFYDPGVGTASDMPPIHGFDTLQAKWQLLLGLAFGRGIYENVAQAYEFLVHNYRPGDRIYLFGFSRGAFTVRSVSGLVHLYGIVRPCAAAMLPLMLRNYFAPADEAPKEGRKSRLEIAEDVRENFTDAIGERVGIHFIGVWDTVASVGGLRSMRISSDPTLQGKPYRHVRHAVSEGEYRFAYEPRLYESPEREDQLKQIWFPGVHSDVGGSYSDAGLSNIALDWMLKEARDCGLRLNAVEGDARWPVGEPCAIAHDQALVSPLWALTGLQRRTPPSPHLQAPALVARGDDPRQPIESRLRFPRHGWFWAALFAMLASYLLVHVNMRWVGPKPLTAFELATLQLQAAWLDASAVAFSTRGFGPLLLADGLFIIAYTCFACTLAVYATLGLRSFRPQSARTHTVLRRVVTFALGGTASSDLLENLFTYLFFAGPAKSSISHSIYGAMLSLFSFGKWLGALTLVSVCVFAAAWSLYSRFVHRPRLPRPAPVGGAAE